MVRSLEGQGIHTQIILVIIEVNNLTIGDRDVVKRELISINFTSRLVKIS